MNGSGEHKITLSQTVDYTLTFTDGKWMLSNKATTIVKDDNPLNINKPGYIYNKDDISASIGNTAFDKFTVDQDGKITVFDEAWDALNDKDTINYTVTYTPDWNNVKWPDDVTPDAVHQDPNGNWVGTINKVINQTVNNGEPTKITLSQSANIIFTWDAALGKLVAAVTGVGEVTVNGNSPINVDKPGFKHDVTSNGNLDFKIDNGNIVVSDDTWKDAWGTLKHGDTIKYTVTYTPDWTGVDLPDNVDFKKDPDNDNIWTANTTINKVITQIVNGNSQQITLSQDVTYTLTFKDGKWELSDNKYTAEVTVEGNNPLVIPTKPGYNINDVKTDNGNLGFTLENGTIVVTDEAWKDAWSSFADKNTIKYTVSYKPNLDGVELPDEINKDNLVEQPNGTLTGSTTINKVINQTVNGSSNQITLSQIVSVTLTLVDGKWIVDTNRSDVTVKDDNPLNINKDGYKHEISATINGSTNGLDFKEFTIDDNGNIVVKASAWYILKDGDTINYTVDYTPIKPQPDTVTPPNKDDDNIWSDDVTDKEKDDIIDKIEDGDLTWTDNGDGTWSATVDFNKQLSQSVSGNMINGLPNITVDVTKKVTLTAKLKGDKFHLTSVTSGKWTSDSNLGQKLPESDNKYDISATVNGNDHAGLKAEVENTNTIPGLDSDLIQSIINNHEYGSLLQLSYVINANPGSADPDKPAEPDTPNVDSDMGVDPENPSNPDDNNGSDDSNNSGNNPGSSDSTENITPKPEEGPEVKPVTTPTEFTPPLSEDIEDDDKKANPDSDSAQSESNKDNKGKTVTGSKATGKKAIIISLSESATASQNSSANSQNSLATTDKEIALPQTGENKDNLSMMGIIMAGLAGALTTLGTTIKKKKN
ncbi:LPXTG cell wall anchor domain-containing protein [Lactobacillus acidophilus]|uniref:LPXTG cell wall anchor domain-containing protein n=1 Tax=Lactobacillus acidophilus TaxID=1579 RepID=UPI0021A6CFBF|nr:LPXTG cell wall anchor domain-containing protein [Lactobacillus acidophilus]